MSSLLCLLNIYIYIEGIATGKVPEVPVYMFGITLLVSYGDFRCQYSTITIKLQWLFLTEIFCLMHVLGSCVVGSHHSRIPPFILLSSLSAFFLVLICSARFGIIEKCEAADLWYTSEMYIKLAYLE